MPLILADRVRDTTTTTGTGTVTLSGTAPTGYQNFSVIGNGNTTYYTINAGSQWEVGIGTYSSTGPTLARNTVLESSNANALVNFAAGVKDVFVTYPSDEAVYQDGAVIAAGTAILGVTNGGTGAAAAAGARTNLGATTVGGNFFTLANPTAITFPRINADNTVSALSAADFRTAIGAGTGSGTVTSVALSGGTTGLTVSGSPITTSGTITLAGTLAVANGGTGVTTSTGSVSVVLSKSPTLETPILGAATATSIANGLGAVGTPSYTFTGDTNTGMWSPAADTIAFSEGGVEAMRIDSSGNVGIGTSAPSQKLQVAASTNQLSLTTGTNELIARASSTEAALYTFQAIPLVFYNNNAERMRIDSSGNVGIGTSAPNAILELNRNFAGEIGAFIQNPNAGGYVAVRLGNSDRGTNGDHLIYGSSTLGLRSKTGAAITFEPAGTERMRIDSSGNVGIGTSSPGFRLQVNGFVGVTDGTSTIRLANSGGVGLVSTITNHPLAFQTNDTERMRIDSSGNVGIGTASPAVPLEVAGNIRSLGLFQRFDNSGLSLSGGTTFNTGGAGIALRGVSSGFNTYGMEFYAGGSERMRLDTSGNVGIGTSAPNTRLNVASTGSNTLQVDTSGIASNAIFNKNNTAGGYCIFNFSGTGVGSITTNGTTTAYNTFSDARLKDNITDADDAANLIDALHVRKFDWKSNGTHERYGFVAQELVEVAPEAVHQPEDEDQMMGVDYSKLVPMLVKEIQSLRARMAQLEGN